MKPFNTILAVLGIAIILPTLGLAQRSVTPATSSPVVSPNADPGPDVLRVNYFRNANTAGFPDQPIDVVDPGTNGAANMCVDIYVVTPDEELNECCGCQVTPDQLLEFHVNADLTANPGPNGETANNGTIKIISSALGTAGPIARFGPCDPGAPTPTPTLREWINHVNNITGPLQTTESAFEEADLSTAELASLSSRCAFYEANLSGHGLCNCPATPPI